MVTKNMAMLGRAFFASSMVARMVSSVSPGEPTRKVV